MMAVVASTSRMDDLQWPRILNKVITQKWSQLKNTLVMKDFVDYLIQKRVVTLDYWMGLKTKPITESERTEDFLSLVIKFDQQKYNHFLEALLAIHRQDLVKELVKAQSVKPRKDKARSGTKIKGKQESRKGQTDADQLPQHSSVEIPIRKSYTQTDGQNKNLESLQSNDAKQASSKEAEQNSKPAKLAAGNLEKLFDQEQSPVYKSTVVEKLHQGIGTADTNETRGKDSSQDPETNHGTATQREDSGKPTKVVTSQEPEHDNKDIPNSDNIAESEHKDNKDAANTSSKERPDNKDAANTSSKERPDNKDAANTSSKERPGSAKSREETLDRREELLKSKESNLNEKELQLKEHEESLKQKETELLTRENSLLTSRTQISEVGSLPFSPAKQLRDLQLADSEPSSNFTTQSSDVLADVREQLAAMRRVKEEIESEYTMTSCNSPKEEYVKVQDFKTVQHDVEELKEEIATDRSNRENIQLKMECLKQKIEHLQATIETLEAEKEETKTELSREINKLKTELKNTKLDNNESINRIKMEMKSKVKECTELKTSVDKVTRHADKLEERVQVLESNKSKNEIELQRYEREVSDLKHELEAKERELEGLRKVLEDTENEKDDLTDELAALKSEVSRLKADKKRLEQEKKILLSRCVKPQWSQSGMSRHTSFQK